MTQPRWASIRRRCRRDGTTAYAVIYWTVNHESAAPGGGRYRQHTLTFDNEPTAEAFRAAVKAHGTGRALDMHGIDPAPARAQRHKPASVLTVADWIQRHIDHLTGVE